MSTWTPARVTGHGRFSIELSSRHSAMYNKALSCLDESDGSILRAAEQAARDVPPICLRDEMMLMLDSFRGFGSLF